jgi:predicted DNA-binding protein (MmcQ/YjbR family)
MISIKTFREVALSFPGTEESPHFEKTSFRIKKKIFATLDEVKGIATLKFLEIDQSVFCSYNKAIIYPVPNKWGKQGWTHVVLKKIPKEMMVDALNTAYKQVLESQKKKKNPQ